MCDSPNLVIDHPKKAQTHFLYSCEQNLVIHFQSLLPWTRPFLNLGGG